MIHTREVRLPDVVTLNCLFCLTPAEAHLVRLLVKGASLQKELAGGERGR